MVVVILSLFLVENINAKMNEEPRKTRPLQGDMKPFDAEMLPNSLSKVDFR